MKAPMTYAEVEEKLERLCEAVVLLDAGDLPGLGQVHTGLEEFQAWAEAEGGRPKLCRLAGDAAGLVCDVVLEKAPEPGQSLDQLRAMLGDLQRGLRDGPTDALPETPEAAAYESRPPEPASESGFAEAPAAMDFSGDSELLNEFFGEAREHLEQADLHLLTLEADPGDPEAIAAVFRAFHTIKGGAGFLQLGLLQGLSHVAETLLDKVRQGLIRMEGLAIDLSFESVDGLRHLVGDYESAYRDRSPLPGADWVEQLKERIEDLTANPEAPRRLGDILVESGTVSRLQVEEVAQIQAEMSPRPMLGELLVKTGRASAKKVAEGLRKQKTQTVQAPSAAEVIKVDADRLDRMVDLIGELVIAQAMVQQSPEKAARQMSSMGRHFAQMDKITRELQKMSMSLRMVPLRGAFQKMARLVRDLSKDCGKIVQFATQGEETELDKNVVDKIGDPLMHMMRNAIDHAIESPEERTAAGKSPHGRVTLRAFHKGGNVYIEIEDDGRGLDRRAIVAKALERGLLKESESLSDAEVWNLIFLPGFSTAKTVTDLSGRGVGMDVVKRSITALRGQVEIRSQPGQGTVFSIRLPLTLAIIDGMVVVLGAERYVLPVGGIVRAIRPRPEDIHNLADGSTVLVHQNRLLPLFRLKRLLGLPENEEDLETGIILVVEDNGRHIGLWADELLGQQQTVIKPLGATLAGKPGLAGGAIMPDGKVGLILDTADLIRHMEADEAGRADNGEGVIPSRIS